MLTIFGITELFEGSPLQRNNIIRHLTWVDRIPTFMCYLESINIGFVQWSSLCIPSQSVHNTMKENWHWSWKLLFPSIMSWSMISSKELPLNPDTILLGLIHFFLHGLMCWIKYFCLFITTHPGGHSPLNAISEEVMPRTNLFFLWKIFNLQRPDKGIPLSEEVHQYCLI